MLTKVQQKTFEFIQYFIHTHHYAPTVEEIAEGIGIKSKGVAYRYIQALVEAGLITLTPNRRRNISLAETAANNSDYHLPLMGAIAAGQPIEAVTNNEHINLQTLVGANAKRYALRVKGDSMIDEGIFDGDIVICEHCDSARNGTIVVALIDNHEATLKRIQQNSNGTVTLVPANASLVPMVYPASRVHIQGRFIGLLRLVE